MTHEALIAGGGIGGLAAALALGRAGWRVRLFEQTQTLGEVGAGIQLGPNGVRVLQSWGLADALSAVAACPERLEVRDACSARLLGVLPLGERAVNRYGAAYLTVARADLHHLLLAAVQQHTAPQVHMALAQAVTSFTVSTHAVAVQTSDGTAHHAPLLVGADGLWSRVRQQLLADAAPRATGHLAYRAMVPQAALPQALRSLVVTAWLGPKFHVVQYPVRGGAWLNVVALVQGALAGEATGWEQHAHAGELRARLATAQAPLLDLIHAIDDWRLWPLYERPPMSHANQHAQGRVALLGDAAHPMRPYLAQGAGMALEDAQQLATSLLQGRGDVPAALQHYAQARWRRNARVQARAIRNGQIFHATGVVRWGRDASLKLLGERLLDMPWLYGGGP